MAVTTEITMLVIPPIEVVESIRGGFDIVTNGVFATDSDWTKGTGWDITGGVATKAAGVASDLSQSAVFRAGGTFSVTFDVINRTAGTITPRLGGQLGTARSTNATFVESIVAGSSDTLIAFVADSAFDGDIDNVVIKQVFSNVAASTRAEWEVGTPYTTSELVKVSFEIDGTTPLTIVREYTAAQGSTGKYPPNFSDATIPEVTTPDWTDDGPSNRLAMFDELNGTQTTNSGTVDVVITAGTVINSVAVLNFDADSIRVIMTDPIDGVVFDETRETLSFLGINDWYSYYFDPITKATDTVFLDLPAYINASIEVIIDNGAGTAAVGVVAFGRQQDIGTSLFGVEMGIVNYSVKETDKNGNFQIQTRNFSELVNYPILVEQNRVNVVRDLLTSLLDVAAIWVASEEFTSTILYGYYRDYTVVIPGPAFSECNIEVEGLQ